MRSFFQSLETRSASTTWTTSPRRRGSFFARSTRANGTSRRSFTSRSPFARWPRPFLSTFLVLTFANTFLPASSKDRTSLSSTEPSQCTVHLSVSLLIRLQHLLSEPVRYRRLRPPVDPHLGTRQRRTLLCVLYRRLLVYWFDSSRSRAKESPLTPRNRSAQQALRPQGYHPHLPRLCLHSVHMVRPSEQLAEPVCSALHPRLRNRPQERDGPQ